MNVVVTATASFPGAEPKEAKLTITPVIYQVETIEILNLDEALDKECGGTQKGMIYGKEYKLQVKKFKDQEPADLSSIVWSYTYESDDGTFVIGAFRQTGKKVTFKADDPELCGKTITFNAYTEDKPQEGELEVLHHDRLYQVETIEILDLHDGSDNAGGGGTQKGMIYEKKYELQVTKFKDKEPEDLSSIEWAYSYESDDGAVVVGAFRETGMKVTFTTDDLELCGKTVTFNAFIEDRSYEAKLPVFHHNRFRWFDKSTFKSGLTAIKAFPSLVNQHHTSLCGIAAIIYQLAIDDRNLFHDSYLEFFVKGECQINSCTLQPNKSLYEMKPTIANTKYPRFTKDSNGNLLPTPEIMEQADWVILAGSRSSDNKDYEGKDGENWDAINWRDYMGRAALELYGASSFEDKTSLITGRNFAGTLNTIDQEHTNGWKIVMLIDSDMLRHSVSYLGCAMQYHWIVYEGDLNIDTTKGEYTFSYWCWAKKRPRITFKKDVFNTNFYGYIKYKK